MFDFFSFFSWSSLVDYETAKKNQVDLTNPKNKVLDSIKTFRNNYGDVNLNQIIYPIPKEFTKILAGLYEPTNDLHKFEYSSESLKL